MMKKETVINTLETLDDEFDAEKLIEKLLFIEKVDQGLKDVSDGKLISLHDAKQKFEAKWNK